MDPILIALIVIAVLAAVAGFATGKMRRHPPGQPETGIPGERPGRGDEDRNQPQTEGYPGTDRPAGPGAEADAVAGAGEPTPGQPTPGDTGPVGDAARPSDAGGDAGRNGKRA
jgi:hypothetical protein